jgi:hypothetical protein
VSLLAALLAERFPTAREVEREMRRKPEDSLREIAHRRRVLCEALDGYGLRGRVPKAAA